MKSIRSKPFHATRKHHGTESAEDYTELIADLIKNTGEARTCNIADHLGISHVTALRTIRRLQEQGFVKTEKHKPVVLTPKGRELASHAKKRHDLLMDFFVKIGVSSKQAEIDVEGAEHHISRETLGCIASLIKTL
jgi:DtxR family manganese transport transcriptional regulator